MFWQISFQLPCPDDLAHAQLPIAHSSHPENHKPPALLRFSAARSIFSERRRSGFAQAPSQTDQEQRRASVSRVTATILPSSYPVFAYFSPPLLLIFTQR